jgi:hypothetical protein
MTTRKLLALCATVSLVACGGASTAAIGDPSGDAATKADAGAPAAEAGLRDAGSEASVTADAGLDGKPADAPIDPIVLGHRWTYDVKEVGNYPLCPSGSGQSAEVLGVSTRDGRQAYEVRSFCQYVGSVYYAEDGDVVYWDYDGTWILVIDAPVIDGHTWTNGVTSYAWHDVGSVTVPAGTFSQCFKAADTLGPTYTILCRGVGPVQWSYRDASGNGYDAVLTAKNF